MRRLVPSVALALALALAPRAAAQEGDASLDREARMLFEAGREAFDRGRFESALDYFQRAFALSRRPGLLYNIGAAADRLRRDDVALEAFRRFLAEAPPDDSTREQVEARIAAIEEAIAARDGDGDTPDAPAEPIEEDDAVAEASPVETAREPTDASGPGPVPWILVGGGGALAIAGVVLLVAGLGDVSSVENAEGKTWREIQPAYDRAPVLSGIGIVGLCLGLAVAGTGIVIAVTSSSGSETEVAVGPGTVLVRGSF